MQIGSGVLAEGVWVGLCVPRHHVVATCVILFEACELLLYEDSATVVEMVGWHFAEALAAVPHVPSIILDLKLSFQVNASEY